MTTDSSPDDGFPLIGLIGHKGAGKSTLARILHESCGCEEVAFAAPLKEIALLSNPPMFDAPLASLVDDVGWDTAKSLLDVREYLQHLGDGIRAVDPAFFIRRAVLSAGLLLFQHPVVISDVRFPNEAQAVIDLGGTLVRVIRDDADESALHDAHPSEHALDDYPVSLVIDNNGPVWELHASAIGLIAAATAFHRLGVSGHVQSATPLD